MPIPLARGKEKERGILYAVPNMHDDCLG